MDTKHITNKRSLFVGILFTILFFLLIVRAFYIQVLEAPVLQAKAKNIWNSSATIEPKRGKIYDRNNDILTNNGPAYTVIAVLSEQYPNHVQEKSLVAKKLAPILNMEEMDIYQQLTKDVFQVEIRPGGWKIDKEKAELIKSFKLPGIILREETKRYYPNNYLASHVIGFINYDNKPILGLEYQYNKDLSGTKGKLKVMKDRKGYELPDGEEIFEPAVDGSDLVLTIDKTLQQYVETALDKAQAMYNPKKMIAIVADPNTGEILAMANRPNFNPNKYWGIEDYRNYAIHYQFEPGSTFKIVTLAAAIEEGYFNPDETYMSGKIKVPGKVIQDHNNGKGWGEITYLEGVQMSSNVAFVKLGYERLGKEKLFSYIDKFGFGELTGIDLPNEAKGIMKDVNKAYPLDVATISFGQGVAVTPIQQVAAVSAVANGGMLMKPYIVKEIRDFKADKIIYENKPTEKRRVISEETAKETRDILEKVVEFGTQKPGYIEGYHVAGKTGTAQKIGADGTYLKDKNIASFIGFAPANQPRLIVYVAVDEPDLNIPYYGSTVAAPIFKEIMQNSLRYLKVPIDSETAVKHQGEKFLILNDYTNQTITSSQADLFEKNLNPIVIGDGSKVLKQYPKEGVNVAEGTAIYLVTITKEDWRIPDLKGKSLREALELAYVLDINLKFKGSGIITEQNLKPNTKYKDGQILEIVLQDPEAVYAKEQSP